MNASIRIQMGFTLIELTFVLLIIGSVGTLLNTYANRSAALNESRYRQEQLTSIRNIVNGLLAYSSRENRGVITAPYTGDGYVSAPVDEGNSVLTDYIQSGSSSTRGAFNDDGFGNVRVMQVLSPRPTVERSIVGNSPIKITIVYDKFVVYQTNCHKTDNTCNTGVPGSSSTYTAANWDVTHPDVAGVPGSTLSLQEEKWKASYQKIIDVSTLLRNEYIAAAARVDGSDATNWFYVPPGLNAAGKDPALNDGCRHGWFNLWDVNVLEYYGFSRMQYAYTEFGGGIQYCADYDALGRGADVRPHVAALRIFRNVTTGTEPSALSANNIIFQI